jgi:hypothetical protein
LEFVVRLFVIYLGFFGLLISKSSFGLIHGRKVVLVYIIQSATISLNFLVGYSMMGGTRGKNPDIPSLCIRRAYAPVSLMLPYLPSSNRVTSDHRVR